MGDTMSELSRSAWKTAWRSLLDAFGAITKFPVAYLAFFVLMGVQQYLTKDYAMSIQTPDQLFGEAGIKLTVIGLIISFAAMAFWIPLIRYFAGGDETHPYGFQRPFLRVVGWWLGLSVALLVVSAPVIWAVLYFASQDSTAVAVSVFLVYWLFLTWVALRLFTLWPALALDEPTPLLKPAFAETKGHVWFMIRTFLSVFVLMFLILFAFLIALGVVVGFSDPTQMTEAQKVIDAILGGFLGAVMMGYGFALLGRIFRRVRERPQFL